MRMFTRYHVFVHESVVLHCPFCNDFAANIFNKNLIKNLKIPLFSPSNYLIRRGSCQLRVGQLRDLPYRNPTSRRTQRKNHGAWARSNLSKLRSLAILSKETSFVVEYWKYQTANMI